MAFAMKQLGNVQARSATCSRRSAVKVQATSRVDRSKKSDIIVSPSILSANFATLGAEVSAMMIRTPRSAQRCSEGLVGGR